MKVTDKVTRDIDVWLESGDIIVAYYLESSGSYSISARHDGNEATFFLSHEQALHLADALGVQIGKRNVIMQRKTDGVAVKATMASQPL